MPQVQLLGIIQEVSRPRQLRSPGIAMELSAILLVLSAVITTGSSLLCNSCWNYSSQPCNGSSISCPSDNVCVASFSSVKTGSTVTPQYSITCGTVNQCNITGSLSFNSGNVRTGTSCCDTDICTPTFPTLPSESTQKNGLTCSTCSSGQSDYCYTSETLQCTGVETKCGRMARTLSGTINLKDALRGCATKSFCDILGNQKTSISGLNVDMKMYCSDGADNLHVGHFISIFIAFMTKYLF